MRTLFAKVFLLALLLNGVHNTGIGKHDPALFTSFSALDWAPVDLIVSGFWPARSARFAAREILGIGFGVPFASRVTSAWGRFWLSSENRFGMYYVHFEVKYVHPPYTRYQCSAWVHWPPPAPEHLVGAPFEKFNYCVPF